RDRLRAVMDEAGAACVLEGDPGELEPAALAGAAPQLVLVALDPQSEEALERFDDVLFDPSVDVVYEEAELAAAREGWEVARWQRHLMAKLQRHQDVLPPGHEPEDEPEAPAAQAPAAVADTEVHDSPGPDEPTPASAGDEDPTLGLESAGDFDWPGEAPGATAGANAFDPVLAEVDGDVPEPTADAGPPRLGDSDSTGETGLEE